MMYRAHVGMHIQGSKRVRKLLERVLLCTCTCKFNSFFLQSLNLYYSQQPLKGAVALAGCMLPIGVA